MESKAEMKLKDLHVFDSHIKCTFQDVSKPPPPTHTHTQKNKKKKRRKVKRKCSHGVHSCFAALCL